MRVWHRPSERPGYPIGNSWGGLTILARAMLRSALRLCRIWLGIEADWRAGISTPPVSIHDFKITRHPERNPFWHPPMAP